MIASVLQWFERVRRVLVREIKDAPTSGRRCKIYELTVEYVWLRAMSFTGIRREYISLLIFKKEGCLGGKML